MQNNLCFINMKKRKVLLSIFLFACIITTSIIPFNSLSNNDYSEDVDVSKNSITDVEIIENSDDESYSSSLYGIDVLSNNDFDKDAYYEKLNEYIKNYYDSYFNSSSGYEQSLTGYKNELSNYYVYSLNPYNSKLNDYNKNENKTKKEYEELLVLYDDVYNKYLEIQEMLRQINFEYDNVNLKYSQLEDEFNDLLKLYNQQKNKYISSIIPDVNFMSTISTSDISIFIGDGVHNRFQLYNMARGLPVTTGGGMGNMYSYFFEVSPETGCITYIYPEKDVSQTISFIPKAGTYVLQIPSKQNLSYPDWLKVGTKLFSSNNFDELEAGVKWLDIWLDEEGFIMKPIKLKQITKPSNSIVVPIKPQAPIEKVSNITFKLNISSDDLDKLGVDGYGYNIIFTNNNGDAIQLILNSNNSLSIGNIKAGEYSLTIPDDKYFSLFDVKLKNSVEGVQFRKDGNKYIISISEIYEGSIYIDMDCYLDNNSSNDLNLDSFYGSIYSKNNMFIID